MSTSPTPRPTSPPAPRVPWSQTIVVPTELDTLHRQTGEDTYACAICGATDTLEADQVPSMTGGGTDHTEACSACGARMTWNPFTGEPTLRIPAPAPCPACGLQGTTCDCDDHDLAVAQAEGLASCDLCGRSDAHHHDATEYAPGDAECPECGFLADPTAPCPRCAADHAYTYCGNPTCEIAGHQKPEPELAPDLAAALRVRLNVAMTLLATLDMLVDDALAPDDMGRAVPEQVAMADELLDHLNGAASAVGADLPMLDEMLATARADEADAAHQAAR